MTSHPHPEPEPAANDPATAGPLVPQAPETEATDKPHGLFARPAAAFQSATDTVLEAGQAVTEKVKGTGQAIVKTSADTVLGAGQVVTEKVKETGQAIAKTSADVSGAIAQTASQTGQSVVQFAQGVGNLASRQTQWIVERATNDTGQAVAFVGESPLIRQLSKALKLDWVVGVTEQVDLVKAQEVVRQLQQQHPEESPSQIAHRIMLEKAIYAGGVGLASSLVPGQAIALLAVDLATNTALQTEMLYQIAAAYGLDLADPARKGEVMAIFGLALGGNRAIRAGLAFVKNVPLAGALIGASANATMLYALGYAACRFYEAKRDPDVVETSTETLQEIQQTSEDYLDVAIAQQTVMDQILAHMIVASYPETSWDDILPNLKSLGLHPDSLKAIAQHLKSPQPLDTLLHQLNNDFAVLTLSRCAAIAHLDGTLTPTEAELLDQISQAFELDLDEMGVNPEPSK